jgi:Zn-dependent M32 family carboxypeptidase
MLEYIEREVAIKLIKEDSPEVVYYKKEDAIDCLKCLPAADVVSSSEVEKWKNINEQLYKEMSERIIEERRIWGDFVAKKIFNELEKTLSRKITRSKPQFERLHDKENSLSIWGYKDMGYFQGIISTCEDFQDVIDELKKEICGGNSEST